MGPTRTPHEVQFLHRRPAYDATGSRLSEVRLTGVNVYEFTAGILAWGAHRAAAGTLQGTGALGPVEGFGLEVLGMDRRVARGLRLRAKVTR